MGEAQAKNDCNPIRTKWLVLAVLVLVLAVVVLVRFSNTPAATQANHNGWQRRDLSTPSSRLVGRWQSVHNNGEAYYELSYSPIDPDLRIGTYRIHHRPRGVIGPPFRFKILFEEPSGTKLVLRDFNDSLHKFAMKHGIRRAISRSRGLSICIPKHGMSMTQEEGSEIITVYRYVDEQDAID